MSILTFGRSILGHPEAALRREWLVTNGLGGYAMGSLLANAPTRKYHSLLNAALKPPVARTTLVGGLQAVAKYAGESYTLSSFEKSDGSITPGYKYMAAWQLEFGIPTITFELAEARLIQRIWMEHGANTTYIQWEYQTGKGPLDLHLQPLLTERDHHDTTIEDTWQPTFTRVDHGAEVALQTSGTLKLLSDYATWTTNGTQWFDQVHYRLETYRGHDDQAQFLIGGEWYIGLKPGGSVTLILSTEADPDIDGMLALERAQNHAKTLLTTAHVSFEQEPIAAQLVLAADQFIVQRIIDLPDGSRQPGVSVIAGYPWFSDWGRDTMIALNGLLLATQRSDLAVQTLRTWSHFISQGMVPNRFPDAGDEPEYNTVDATLWFIQALRATYQATQDRALLEDMFPVLEDIIAWHIKGTRYKIKVAEDGLLRAGEPDVQLTWMDAKYQDWVVTPRQGKAVEINALWYSALCTLAEWASELNLPQHVASYTKQAEHVAEAFQRFWNSEKGYLYDVLDGPHGADDALRPNQLFALSVAHSPVSDDQAQHILDHCEHVLLTEVGLRSLSPQNPAYIGHYGGDLETRDAAYHQGTTWGWLLGPYVSAYHQRYGSAAAEYKLHAIFDHLHDAGIGSISEIFDGDEPWTPRGCPWQAWSVAEWLRCWHEL